MKRVQPAKRVIQMIDTNIKTGNQQVQVFKKIIKDAIHVDDDQGPINFDLAITTFEAAQKICTDQTSFIDLALFFSECGAQFLINFGNIDEEFLETMEIVFEQVIMHIKNSDKALFEQYKDRLYQYYELAQHSDEAYADQIKDLLDKNFPGFLESYV